MGPTCKQPTLWHPGPLVRLKKVFAKVKMALDTQLEAEVHPYSYIYIDIFFQRMDTKNGGSEEVYTSGFKYGHNSVS